MLTAVLLILGGLVLLVGGGDILVRGASNIASAIGMSPLVVGLTVVSFATSAPELAVTMGAVRSGSPGLAIGNVVGSNMANILLVLGIAAVITPLAVKSRVVKLDVPVVIGMSVITTLLAANGVIAQWQGAVLILLLVAYVFFTVRVGNSAATIEEQLIDPIWNEDSPRHRQDAKNQHIAVSIAFVIGGVALLVGGASLLVNGATTVARSAGLSDMVIGLTVVAVGTSLPELATAVVAAMRGERDLAIGNAVGSNIFNLGAVLGFAALLSPGGIPIPSSAANFDFILMTGAALLLLPIAYTGARVSRWEGGLFVAYYAAYTVYLLLMSTEHARLLPFSNVMLAFVIPLTALIVIVFASSEWRRSHRSADLAEDASSSA